MKHHLNTLFVTTEGAYLSKEGETVAVKIDDEVRSRTPIHLLDSIVCFGHIGCSPYLMRHCTENNVSITFMTDYGRLLGKVSGFTPGNVLLRREQYRRSDDPLASADIARAMVAAKIANSRVVLQRALRDRPRASNAHQVQVVVGRLAQSLEVLQNVTTLDVIRGVEGEAGRDYFSVFDALVTQSGEDFAFSGRNRRPPRDNVNCLLSFLYSLLTHDARSACESVGLDPQVGFLHRDRPGRPSLALDLIEELRAFLADRLALSLINRGQVQAKGFHREEAGAVTMTDATRKAVIIAYQTRKQEEITHPFLGEKISIGLLVHLQARLLSRALRGDLDAYPAFFWR